MKRLLAGLLAVSALVATPGTAVAAPPNDRFTGAWVSDDGDGSTSYNFLSAPDADGTPRFTLF